jgi:hypothetical protein
VRRVGIKWLVQPLPHRSFPPAAPTNGSNAAAPPPPLWHIEQGVLSSFQRVSQSANIPIQLNFHLLPAHDDGAFIEILKGTPMLQYIPAALPKLLLRERESGLDPGLVDYLVELSLIHKGGDYRQLGVRDQGASSFMQSHTLRHTGEASSAGADGSRRKREL